MVEVWAVESLRTVVDDGSHALFIQYRIRAIEKSNFYQLIFYYYT